MKEIKFFWKVLKEHILATISSIIALVESLILIQNNENPAGKIFCYIVFIFSLLYATNVGYNFVLEAQEKYKRVFLDEEKEKINNYLTNFIKSGSSVAILTHDMSWISDNNREMLQEKAKRRELLLFLPQTTSEVEGLKKMGADVRVFGNLISDPARVLIKSRMTVVDWNKAYPKLTFPQKENGLHINYEAESGNPANALALDLISLLIHYSDNVHNQNLCPKSYQARDESMSKSIFELLEEFNGSNGKALYEKLSDRQKYDILHWYSDYFENDFSIQNALSAMKYLWSRESLDFCLDSEFLRTQNYVCNTFHVSKENFLEMYIHFRNLISD